MDWAMTCETLDRIFSRDPNLTSVLVSKGEGLTLIDRSRFNFVMSGHDGYGRRLFGDEPIIRLPHEPPLVLPSDTPLTVAYSALMDRDVRIRFDDILVRDIRPGVSGRLSAGLLLETVARQHAHEALHDALTGLPNRTYLIRHLSDLLHEGSENLALLFIDIDRFKVVNDSEGHDTGDQLLAAFADRLAHAIREGDIAARMGGDEFAALLHLNRPHGALAIASRVRDALRAPFRLGLKEIVVTASIGITYPEPGDDPGSLLRKADLAMYRAKREGGGQMDLFSTDLAQAARDRMDIEVWLRRSLVDGRGLELHYQPIVELTTGAVSSFEALVRGRDPSGALIPPADFLTVAEETGLILDVDSWVIRRACLQQAGWQAEGRPIGMSINVSPTLLERGNVGIQVDSAIAASGADPHALHIEITEGRYLANLPEAIRTLSRVRQSGVRISIDDFGTGYSSLSHLSQLPVDCLKIDASFVRRIEHNRADRAIVQGILALAAAMEVDVVAEGIETPEQSRLLREMGCVYGQGYLFSVPLPGEDASALISAKRGRDRSFFRFPPSFAGELTSWS